MGPNVSPSVTVRRARHADAAGVWPLAEAFATSYVPRREAFDPAFEAMLASDGAGVFVAEVEGAVVGYLVAHQHATLFANAPVAWIEELMVAEPRRGHGVGRALMDAAEEWARAAGCAYVALATRRAQEFYRAIGYAESAAFFRKQLD